MKEQEEKETRLFISPMPSFPSHIPDNGHISLQVFIEQPLFHGSRSDQYPVSSSSIPILSFPFEPRGGKALVSVALQSIAVALNHVHILRGHIYPSCHSLQLTLSGGVSISSWDPDRCFKISQPNVLGVIAELGTRDELRQRQEAGSVRGTWLTAGALVLFDTKTSSWLLTPWYPHFFF